MRSGSAISNIFANSSLLRGSPIDLSTCFKSFIEMWPEPLSSKTLKAATKSCEEGACFYAWEEKQKTCKSDEMVGTCWKFLPIWSNFFAMMSWKALKVKEPPTWLRCCWISLFEGFAPQDLINSPNLSEGTCFRVKTCLYFVVLQRVVCFIVFVGLLIKSCWNDARQKKCGCYLSFSSSVIEYICFFQVCDLLGWQRHVTTFGALLLSFRYLLFCVSFRQLTLSGRIKCALNLDPEGKRENKPLGRKRRT